MAKSKEEYVLVTTSFRGVFFGKLIEDNGETVTLCDARNCVYWSPDCRGFLGLATTGPTKSCRIGPSVPQIGLRGVTSVAHCTPESVEAWQKSPWA